jgi:hypothetical protein
LSLGLVGIDVPLSTVAKLGAELDRRETKFGSEEIGEPLLAEQPAAAGNVGEA